MLTKNIASLLRRHSLYHAPRQIHSQPSSLLEEVKVIFETDRAKHENDYRGKPLCPAKLDENTKDVLQRACDEIEFQVSANYKQTERSTKTDNLRLAIASNPLGWICSRVEEGFTLNDALSEVLFYGTAQSLNHLKGNSDEEIIKALSLHIRKSENDIKLY